MALSGVLLRQVAFGAGSETVMLRTGSGAESEAVSGQRQGIRVAALKRQMGPIRSHRGASKLPRGSCFYFRSGPIGNLSRPRAIQCSGTSQPGGRSCSDLSLSPSPEEMSMA
jgi:hypothetical protein